MTNNTFPAACIKGDPPFSFTREAKKYYIFMTATCSVMTILTILLNMTFLITMFLNKQLQNLPNKLFMLLSLVDLLQGFTVWPFAIYSGVTLYNTKQVCWWLSVVSSMGYCLGFATVTSIFLITIEQYTAIVHPFFHGRHVKASYLLYPMAATNLSLSIVNFLTSFKFKGGWIWYKSLISIITIILMTSMIYMYIRIIHTAKVTVARIVKTNVEEGKQIKKKAKAAKTSIIILIATIICYSPSSFYNIYEYVDNGTDFGKTYIKLSTEMVALMNSVFDPLVYYWRLKSIRSATMTLLWRLCKRPRKVEDSPGLTVKATGVNTRVASIEKLFENVKYSEDRHIRRRTSSMIKCRSRRVSQEPRGSLDKTGN